MRVIALPEVQVYLTELIQVLYDSDYFGFIEDAENYVLDLLRDIETTLPTRLQKKAPRYFNRYGSDMYYCTFKKSRHTTWYVFYSIHASQGKKVFLVRYISNNHRIAHKL